MKFLKPQQLAQTLVKILPGMFGKNGLTMLDIAPTDFGLFSFRVKELNPRLSFNYDGLSLEMTVNHQEQVIDCLPMISVPLVAVDKGRFYPNWSGSKKFGAGCGSIEQLMRRYLQRQINRMAKMIPETSIYVFMSEKVGFTMARLIDSKHSPMEKDMVDLAGIIKFGVSDL